MSAQNSIGVTINQLQKMRDSNEKIACLTAYDAAFAKLLDQSGMDVILVGDSLGMVVQGNPSTVSVTMDDMIYHTECVAGSAKHSLVVSDLSLIHI